MATITQKELFSWEMLELSSEIRRLGLVLDALPDEKLMQALEAERKGRRDDYPLRSLWNSLLAGIVFGHESIESLRRELRRNAELRQVCGLSALKGEDAVAPAYVYTRFFEKLFSHQELLDEMFDRLVAELQKLLPDLGQHLAIDSKAINSHARGKTDPKDSSDPDADWGKKTYKGKRKDGTLWEKVKSWFGYKVHLIVDANYELPVAYRVTQASVSDPTQLLPMMSELQSRHDELVEQAKYASMDKAYDSADNNRELWDEYEIKPLIDIRATWKENKNLPRQLYPDRVDTIFYNESGEVLCRPLNAHKDEVRNYAAMEYKGFEAERGCLKYRCPAAAYGLSCTQRDICQGGEHTEHGRIVRVPLEEDRRIFVPQARSSYTWKREYKKRTAVERVNSRLDVSFGFERHFIRGMKKMRFRMGLSLVVMLAMAVGRIKAGEGENMRSLVRVAA